VVALRVDRLAVFSRALAAAHGNESHERASGRIDREVVQSIVRLGKSVGTRTIAEFVGDQSTLDLLSSYGVDYAQGYHLGHPQPVAAM
jgi:EAL domain-containing protein (putative c-di-GMP-specific phosphodiesterase class I)